MKTIQFSKTSEVRDLILDSGIDRYDQFSDDGRGYVFSMYSKGNKVRNDALNDLLHELTWVEPFSYLAGSAYLIVQNEGIIVDWHASRNLELEGARRDFERLVADLFGIPPETHLEDIFTPTPSLTISGDIGRKVTLTELVLVAFIDKHFNDGYEFTKSELRKIKSSPALRIALYGYGEDRLKREVEKKLREFLRKYNVKKSTFYLHYNDLCVMQSFEKQSRKFLLI